LAHTRLTEDAAELACFCIFPTWFQDVLPVLPCQVITGSAPEALRVLDILYHFCREAELLAGIRRSQLVIIRYRCRTSLIWEPNLNKRTAELLSSLTDKRFLVVERSFWDHFARSTAVYAGENPDTHQIQNSIQIHITPTKADSSADPPWLQKMFERIPVHLAQYRERNLDHVAYSTWAPSGLSSEAATIASEIGRCIVDAPRLRQKLVTLLKEQETQRFLDMSTIVDAVVVEATQTLSHDGREHAYAREVAEKANRLFEARGETTRLSPEKVGHRWRKLGLRSRPLSQQGNGLVFDKATLASLKQLAAEYGMEDAPTAAENLNG
jgi:hypothetical protein